MAEADYFPADLYVQPPDGLSLEQKAKFTRFVMQFDPAAFIQADQDWIILYLQLMHEIKEITGQIAMLPEYVQENALGMESPHPLIGVRKTLIDQASLVAKSLQITPNFRYQPTPYIGAVPTPGENGNALPGEVAGQPTVDMTKLSVETMEELLAARQPSDPN